MFTKSFSKSKASRDLKESKNEPGGKKTLTGGQLKEETHRTGVGKGRKTRREALGGRGSCSRKSLGGISLT